MRRYLILILMVFFLRNVSLGQVLPTFPSKSKSEKSTSKPISNQQKQTSIPGKIQNNNTKQKDSENQSKESVIQIKKFLLKINCNADATLYIDGEKSGTVKNGEIYKLFLDRGVYDLKLASLNTPSFDKMDSYKVMNNEDQDIWHVSLHEKDEKYFLIQEKLKELNGIIHAYYMPAYNDNTDGNFYSYFYPNYSIDNMSLKIEIQSQQKWPDGRESERHGYMTAMMDLKELNKISVKRYKFDNPAYKNELYVIEFSGVCSKYFGSDTTDKKTAMSMFIPITPELRNDCEYKINELLKTLPLPLNLN